DAAQPIRCQGKRLLPGNLLELTRAARTGAQKRRLEPRRRVVLHDAGRTLGAQNAAIDRVVAITLDIADLAVLEVDIDPAPAGAQIAGPLANLVRNRPGKLNTRA